MIALSRLGGAHNAPEFRDARQTLQCFAGNLCANTFPTPPLPLLHFLDCPYATCATWCAHLCANLLLQLQLLGINLLKYCSKAHLLISVYSFSFLFYLLGN